MADNVAITPGAGATIAADDIAGVLHQRIKIQHGADGSAVDTSAANPLPTTEYALGTGAYRPDPHGARTQNVDNGALGRLLVDSDGSLITRAAVTGDEGSFRDDFPGSSLAVALTGTVAYGAASASITGTGTAFLTELSVGDYIKLNAGAEADWTQVLSIESDTAATLVANYPGGAVSGASSYQTLRSVTASGGGYTVTNSTVAIASGTAIAGETLLDREVDYGPLVLTFFNLVASQRIANNQMIFGLQNSRSSPRHFSRFRLTGTDNTSVIFETAFVRTGTPAAADTETTTITLPQGLTTAVAARYRIELNDNRIRAYINDVLVAEHVVHMPDPYDVMDVVIGHINGGSAPATSTNLTLDAIALKNVNTLPVSILSNNEVIIAGKVPGRVVSGSAAANNTNLISLDCADMGALTVQIYGTFVATVAFQGCNEPTFTTTVASLRGSNPDQAGGAISTTTGNSFFIPVTHRYIRIRTTAYTSGTVLCNTFIQAQAIPPQTVQSIYNGTQAVSASGNFTVVGAAAHDAVISGNPERIAGRALTANYTAVASGDVADLVTTLVGALITKPYAIPELDWSYAAAASGIVNTTTAVTIRAAQAAGIRNYISSIQVSADALGAATELAIRDGAAGTVLWRLKLGTGGLAQSNFTFTTPLRGSAATLLEVVTLTATTTGGVFVNVQGYSAP